MPGRNSGICHSYRAKDHYFDDCKRKRPYRICNHGFEKCFVVEKKSQNKGRLSICYSKNCGLWEWAVKENESSGSYPCDSTSSNNLATNETTEDMSQVFRSRVRISDDEELHISVNVAIQVDKVSTQHDAKGKKPA